MGVVQKQGLSVAAISFVGVVIGAVNTLFLFPNFLGAEKHGLLMLYLSIAAVICQFIHLGIPNTIIRFFPFLKDHKKYVYRLALQVPLMSITLLALLLYFFGANIFASYTDRNILFDDYSQIILPLVASLVFFELLLSISRSELKTVFPAFLRELLQRLVTGGLIIAYFFERIDFDDFIYLWLSSYAFIVFVFATYLISRKILRLEFGFPLFMNKEISKKMLKYSAVTLLTSSAAILVNKIDVLMLGYYLEVENISFYTVAFFMASLIHIPARSILQIVKPLLAQAWAEDDRHEIEKLYRKTAINQMFIGLLLFLGIWMNIDDILSFMNKDYQGIQMVFFYVGLAKLIDVSAGANGAIIATSQNYRFDLYINLLLVITTIVANIYFIPRYGIVGAAIATALALFVHNIIKTLVLYNLYSIQPFNLKTLKLIVIGVGVYFLVNYIPFDSIEMDILRIILRSIIIGFIFISLSLIFSVSEDVNLQLKKIFG